MSAILRMFKVPLLSALFNPAITDSFDAAPSPSAESPYRRASGVLSHALKSCDSVKGSLWQGASRAHSIISCRDALTFLLKWAREKKKNKRERVTSWRFAISDSWGKKTALQIQPRLQRWMHFKRWIWWASPETGRSLQMSAWKQCLRWINTISVFSNCGPPAEWLKCQCLLLCFTWCCSTHQTSLKAASPLALTLKYLH